MPKMISFFQTTDCKECPLYSATVGCPLKTTDLPAEVAKKVYCYDVEDVRHVEMNVQLAKSVARITIDIDLDKK